MNNPNGEYSVIDEGKRLLDDYFDHTLTCSLCGTEIFNDLFFCEHCLKTLPYNNGAICDKCGRKVEDENILCNICGAEITYFDTARSCFNYEYPINSLLSRLKYNNKKYLAKELGATFMPYVFYKYNFEADFIVFVPMYPADEKKRGYNQSRLLAETLSEKTGVPLLDGLLFKNKPTKKQASQDKAVRMYNLLGSFSVSDKSKIKDKKILLVDDTMTTGATLDECSRALKKSGAAKVSCLTVSSSPDRSLYDDKKRNKLVRFLRKVFKIY